MDTKKSDNKKEDKHDTIEKLANTQDTTAAAVAAVAANDVDKDSNAPSLTGKKGRFTVKFPNNKIDIEKIGATGSVSKEGFTTAEMALIKQKLPNNKKNLYLYDEDMKSMPRTVTFLDSFKIHLDSHVTYPSAKTEKRAEMLSQHSKLGTLLGVYLPTIQHIMGLLMFIRHSWMVGHCGLLEAVAMVFMCCLTTFFTAMSVSAIATNGILQSGGSYYVLSRNLGPECGGSIGICFYLANTFATCLYLLGSIELFLVYMAPEFAYFGDIHHDPWNNYRVYGTCLLLVLTIVVALGVKIVQLFAPLSLICVILSILSIVIGAFISHPEYIDVKVCMVGEKLYKYPDKNWWKQQKVSNASESPVHWCSKNETSYLYHKLCKKRNGTMECDAYFLKHNVTYTPAIPGITSNVGRENLYSHYMGYEEVAPGIHGHIEKGEVVSDITTNFIILCAIYFPSVTGILTGVNMSGDLKNPQKSIPKGTILAQLTCSFVYMLLIILYGVTIKGHVLRDKFGASLGGELISALLCWPNKWVVLVGAFASSIGAGLQCLVSAPRLLQAIARDDIIPFLSIFKVLTKKGEPIRALGITFFIAEIGMIIANIDAVAPIIDVFFLMCYLFVNFICVLQSILKLPNWRPRFKYYHWTLSLCGVGLNFALCIIAGWYYALSAFLIAAFIFVYIQYKGSEKEWGDGMTGLLMTFTERALLSLDDETHIKNWRPQILVLDKVDPETSKLSNPELLRLVSQLKHGRGLSIVATVLIGDYLSNVEKADSIKKNLMGELSEQKIKGFVKLLFSSSVEEGVSSLVQSIGIGAMVHNTVLICWPHDHSAESQHSFINSIRLIHARKLTLLVLKSPDFPTKSEKMTTTIDIWWIIHDGGMLILLSFLLQQHRIWRGCKIRIFTVAHVSDNSILIKNQLEEYLYEIRIHAEVYVVEMFDSDISAYEVERTLNMESRVEVMRKAAAEGRPVSHRSFHKNRQDSGKKDSDPDDSQDKSSHERSSIDNANPTTSAGLRPNESGLFMRDIPASPDHNAVDPKPSTSQSPQNSPSPPHNTHFTFSPLDAMMLKRSANRASYRDVNQFMKMHNAMQLNKAVTEKSGSAALVILNLPAPPAKLNAEENYMSYLEMLSEGLTRVLFVRGSGKEVVSLYS